MKSRAEFVGNSYPLFNYSRLHVSEAAVRYVYICV